jgi:hypothetical protein
MTARSCTHNSPTFSVLPHLPHPLHRMPAHASRDRLTPCRFSRNAAPLDTCPPRGGSTWPTPKKKTTAST